MTAPKPKLRWFQFSLRTLLVIVTLCAIPCSWLAVKIHEEKSLRDERNRQWRVVQAIERSSGVLEECSIRAFEIIEIRPEWLNHCLGGHYHGQISELDFRGSLIKDGDLESLKSLCNLQRLRLDNTSITDAGLQHLECLPKLYRLSLSGTHISEAGLIKLQKALPNCKIER